ncbi:MAG: hypothetical protein LUG47_05275 [Clostridiales bacterium]|nr:hypothetical protein [Clostridiales bacterium]
MKTTMSNEEMGRCVEILSTLKESGKLGYAVARNLRLLRTAATEYLDARAKAFQKYGTADQNTGTSTISVTDYVRELGEIPYISHEVDLYQVDEETFISGSLTSDQMSALLWMVKEDSPANE